MAAVRFARQDDLSSILEIYNDAIVNTTAVYDYRPHTLEMRKAWMEEKEHKEIPVLVAEVDGRVAGFASYGPFRAWAAYQFSVEHSVYVSTDFRRQGIASILLKELIAVIKQKEIHTMIAGIDADNAISILLHEKLGFKEVGRICQVGYKFGRWLDLKFFQLILDSDFTPKENPL